MSALAAAGSEIVITSATTRRASISCMNRRRTAEPPERKSSTLIPVWVWNRVAIFWAVSTGVDVYHVTPPSFLAAARSTVSGVKRGACPNAVAVHSRTRMPASTRALVIRTLSSRAPVDRSRLAEEALQDVVGDGDVLLVEAGVRDARHHRELLVRVGQPREEVQQVLHARD